MRVNNCLPCELINVNCQRVNKQGGVYNTPLFTQVFTLMNGQGGQSVRLLENDAFSNAKSSVGRVELRVKAAVSQSADKG